MLIGVVFLQHSCAEQCGSDFYGLFADLNILKVIKADTKVSAIILLRNVLCMCAVKYPE